MTTSRGPELRSESFAPAFRESIVRSGYNGLRRLVFSGIEADNIATQLAERDVFKAVGFEASRATVMSPQMSQFRVIHFATHGLIDTEHPELSSLVLSLVDEDGKQQDGWLRLHDVYNLDLNAELVVLSACQTALGREVKGEGLIGLTRGFMYAGAERVVASLWSVQDNATAELMKFFYANMLGEKHLPPAAALRAAQLEMLKNSNKRAPCFWAGFVLQGDWR